MRFLVSINDVINDMCTRPFMNTRLKKSIKYYMKKLISYENEKEKLIDDKINSELRIESLEYDNRFYKSEIERLENEIELLIMNNNKNKIKIEELESKNKNVISELENIIHNNKKRKIYEI